MFIGARSFTSLPLSFSIFLYSNFRISPIELSLYFFSLCPLFTTMAKSKNRSPNKRTHKSPSEAGSSKKQKLTSIDAKHSSSELSFPEPSLKSEFISPKGGSKSKDKPILKEKMVDLELFNRIGLIEIFDSLQCSSLLSPSIEIYPSLVKEFYSNLSMVQNDMIYSQVKNIPIVLTSAWLGSILGVRSSGLCPFTSHQPFTEFDDLDYDEQLRTIQGNNSVKADSKPSVSTLSPTCLLLFKLFHTNLLPRKSSRDRVTFQDSILLSLFVKKTPFNVASLLIRNMNHCASHESMHLPYPSILTKVFIY